METTSGHEQQSGGTLLLQTLAGSDAAPVFAKDLDGRYLFANRCFLGLQPSGRDSVVGLTDYDLFAPEVAEEVRRNDRLVAETRQPIVVEEHVPGGEGIQTFLALKFPLFGTGGCLCGVGGIALLIEERSRAAQRLRESEERYRLLLDAVRDYAIFTLDPQGRISSWNEGAQRIKGWPAAEAIGKPYADLFLDDDVEKGEPARILETARREGRYTGEMRRRRKGGSSYWAEVVVTPLRGDRGDLLGFVAVTHDVTDRRRLEEQRDVILRAGQLFAQSLDRETTLTSIASLFVHELADYCIVDLLDEAGELQRVAMRARDPALQSLVDSLLPFTPKLPSTSPVAKALQSTEAVVVQQVGQEWLEQIALGPEHRRALEILAPRSVILLPLVAHDRALGVIQIAWRDPCRATKEMVAVGSAVAMRAALALDNARLFAEAQEAARQREEVVAVVSHDLRNPLNVILLSSKALLERDEELNERQAVGLGRIRRAAERAEKLIHELLDFTRLQAAGMPVQREPLDFHRLVRETSEEVALARPAQRVDVRAEGSGAGEWDAARLSQLVANLVANAVQYAPPGSAVEVRSVGTRDEVILEVHNSGPPIPPELRPVLFDPFRRGTTKGARGSLGLGLFIAQGVVHAHGGSIEASSSAEEGTTFTVRLPRHAPETQNARPG